MACFNNHMWGAGGGHLSLLHSGVTDELAQAPRGHALKAMVTACWACLGRSPLSLKPPLGCSALGHNLKMARVETLYWPPWAAKLTLFPNSPLNAHVCTHAHTHRHTDTDTHTCMDGDTHMQRHTYIQTHTLTDTHCMFSIDKKPSPFPHALCPLVPMCLYTFLMPKIAYLDLLPRNLLCIL